MTTHRKKKNRKGTATITSTIIIAERSHSDSLFYDRKEQTKTNSLISYTTIFESLVLGLSFKYINSIIPSFIHQDQLAASILIVYIICLSRYTFVSPSVGIRTTTR